jgi:hypothetical protein
MKSKFLLVPFVAILFSCNGGDDEVTNPPIPTQADIAGKVKLYDEGDTQIDNSNMTVKLEGSSKSATTDEAGDFVLTQVAFGTYNLVYEKEGYGTFKKFGVEHKDGKTFIPETASLGEVSTTKVTVLEAAVEGGNVLVSVTTDPAGSLGNKRFVRYFLSTDPGVSDEKYTYYSGVILFENNPVRLVLTPDFLEGEGFASGQTVYVKAYGDSVFANEYLDPDLNRWVFPNLNMNAADAVSFVVP